LSLNLLTLGVFYRRAIRPLPVPFDACVSEKFRGVNQRSLRAFRISLEMESGLALQQLHALRLIIGVEPKLLHLVAERVAGDIEEFRGVGLVAVGLLQRQADQFPFHLFQ